MPSIDVSRASWPDIGFRERLGDRLPHNFTRLLVPVAPRVAPDSETWLSPRLFRGSFPEVEAALYTRELKPVMMDVVRLLKVKLTSHLT